MRDGFIKIAAATPDLHVADCAYNTSEIVKLAKEAAAKGAKLITFPELCLTGYTCGDLFLQETLLEGAMQALNTDESTDALRADVQATIDFINENYDGIVVPFFEAE